MQCTLSPPTRRYFANRLLNSTQPQSSQRQNPMTPLFVFLFSVPCLTALFMITFQLIEEHVENNKSQLPFEGFGRPTAKIQFSSFREIVATQTALSPLQSWAAAGNSAST